MAEDYLSTVKDFTFCQEGRKEGTRKEGRKGGVELALEGRAACGTYSILTRPFGISLLVLSVWLACSVRVLSLLARPLPPFFMYVHKK